MSSSEHAEEWVLECGRIAKHVAGDDDARGIASEGVEVRCWVDFVCWSTEATRLEEAGEGGQQQGRDEEEV